MDITDGIDAVVGLLPAPVKRAIMLCFLGLVIMSTPTATALLAWYATHKSASIVHMIEHNLPTATAVPGHG
jgi:hypothetical protein